MNFIIVGIGGFLGAISRYTLYLTINSLTQVGFPLATLLVNTLGSFGLGSLVGILGSHWHAQHPLFLGISVGFFGAFTTFSAFGFDTLALLQSGSLYLALLNALLNVVLSVTGIFLGRWLFLN